ncbi:MAG: hypothetical protein ACR2NT_09085, partial [Acidimicrobiia bacterium]
AAQEAKEAAAAQKAAAAAAARDAKAAAKSQRAAAETAAREAKAAAEAQKAAAAREAKAASKARAVADSGANGKASVPTPNALASPKAAPGFRRRASRLGFEAIEYRIGGDSSSSGVSAESIAKYTTLEPAIEAARYARANFGDNASGSDAWWVVWDLDTKRAAWIAEHGTPGESVIDLRSGRKVPSRTGE